MDAEKLTGRLQAILRDRRARGGVGRAGESGGEPGAPGRPDPPGTLDPQDALDPQGGPDAPGTGCNLRLERPPTPAEAFGAEERRGRAGRYLVVERSVDQDSWHGDRTAGEYETLLARHTGAVAVVAPDLARVAAGPPGSWLFFDLEDRPGSVEVPVPAPSSWAAGGSTPGDSRPRSSSSTTSTRRKRR